MTRFYKLYGSSNVEGSQLEKTTEIWLEINNLAKYFSN